MGGGKLPGEPESLDVTDMEGVPAGKGAEAKQLQLSVSCSLGKCV